MRAMLALAMIAFFAVESRADEADDELARRLASIVRDPRRSSAQRVDAAQSLAKLGPKAISVLDEMTTQLRLLRGREQESLQEAVVAVIGAMGPAAKSALPDLSRSAGRSIDIDQAIQTTKGQLLENAQAYEFQMLSRQLTSQDELKRLTAAKALGKLGNAAALPLLTKALADTDADVRRACIEAIRKLAPGAKPSKELLQAYIVDLTDADDAVRLAAVRALGKFGSAAAEASAAIQNLATDPDKDVRKAATEALSKIAGP